MNAATQTTQALTTEQQRRVYQLVSEAGFGFHQSTKAKTDTIPSEDEYSAFEAKVLPKITASVLKASANNDKDKRASRLKAVDALAADNNIKFLHRRELEEIEGMIDFEVVGRSCHIETIEVDTVNATRGGETLAYVYQLDDNNNLSISYSVAFCRPDENFDPLIGKEESLKKFLNDDVLSAAITHEKFGPVKLLNLVSDYKHVENASKAFSETK